MLTAAQIDALRRRSEQLLDPIIDFLIEDIAKRVSEAGQMTGTAAYQVWRAQQLGMSQKQLKKEIAKRLGVSQKEAEKLLTQAAETGYNFDMSRFPTSQAIPLSANSSLQQILAATVQLANEDLSNMTQTMGFVGPDGIYRELTDAYTNACDFAFQKVSTGAQDYVSAVREATANLAKKGIRTIDYESGVHTSLEAAVRRNIMGGMGIMQEQISQHNHDSLGCDGWEISAHAASAPDHEPIQGKQYTDEEYTRLNNSLVRRIGTLHCGHWAFGIMLGVHSPQYTPEELEEMRQENEKGITYEGKHYTMFEATQRQRNLERAARDRKRMILIDEQLGDKDKLQNDQIRLQMIKQEYSRFSKAAGLPMQHARMEAAGFDWKKGKAAEKTAKTAKSVNSENKNLPKILAKPENSAIIKTKWDNDLPPRGQITEQIAADDLCSWVANELGIPESEATEYVKAVAEFTDATSGIYSEIRRFQRKEPLQFLPEDKVKKLSDDIETYIQKAPRWNGGVTFRGVSVSNAELTSYIPGKRIPSGGTCSWSGNQGIARGFATRNTTPEYPNSVIYHCETQSKGTGIKHLSVYEHEDEVLCSKESAWEIFRTEVDSEHITHVYVKEV